MLTSVELVQHARSQIDPKGREPGEADFRRAVSTAYYAVFHELCIQVANEFAGTSRDGVWAQFYRALDHGQTKIRCSQLRALSGTSQELKKFAESFATLQIRRHRCDYDPELAITKAEAQKAIGTAVIACFILQGTDAAQRRLFLSHVLLGKRREPI